MNQIATNEYSMTRRGKPFGTIPAELLPYIRGGTEFFDIGEAVMGFDLGILLLVNLETVHLLAGENPWLTPQQKTREVRRGLLRVLNALTEQPCTTISVLNGSAEWFGRPVLVQQNLDCKQPFIVIAA